MPLVPTLTPERLNDLLNRKVIEVGASATLVGVGANVASVQVEQMEAIMPLPKVGIDPPEAWLWEKSKECIEEHVDEIRPIYEYLHYKFERNHEREGQKAGAEVQVPIEVKKMTSHESADLVSIKSSCGRMFPVIKQFSRRKR